MDLHSSFRVLQVSLDILDVIGELDGVSQYEHPGLAVIGGGWLFRVVRRITHIHHLLSHRDTYLWDCSQGSYQSEISDVGEGVAAFFSWLVDDDGGVLFDWSVRRPVQGSQMIQLVASSGWTISAQNCASGSGQLRKHADLSDIVIIDQSIGSVRDSLQLINISLRNIRECNIPVQVQKVFEEW